MNCPRCNSWNPDSAATCFGCGASLNGQAPVSSTPMYNAPNQNSAPNYYSAPNQNGAPNYYNVPNQNGASNYYRGTNQGTYSEDGKGMATASLVLGIVSFFCAAVITGPLAIIFGSAAKSKGYKGASATAGLACGIIALVLYILGLILTVAINS